ncbi:MAG TPA: hypothetical protein VET89_13635 [Stellaceae bacterium]|nr:hypothetical protein [Stellaceae bacterium]
MRRIREWMKGGKAALLLVGIVAVPAAALADFKVKLPDAEPGELELETVGNYGRSGNPATDNEQSFVHEIEYGVTNFWKTGLEFETGRDPGPGNHLKFNQLTWENWLVFGERGQYWLDPALFIEYGHPTIAGAPDEIKFGPLLRKEIGPTINTVNLFLAKEIGQFAGSGRMSFSYAWETRIATGWVVEPGFQAYGEPGPIGHFVPISAQDHRIGPQVFGAIHDFGSGTLKFNAGVLFGLTPAAPRQAFRWQAEYEIHF